MVQERLSEGEDCASFCLISELGWLMQLDLSKNSFASKAKQLRSVGRGESGRRGGVGGSHLSMWTMGVLVNEFASRLIRQPYFSRISNHSCFGTGAALSAVGVLAEVRISQLR